jgi:hypothetical protein
VAHPGNLHTGRAEGSDDVIKIVEEEIKQQR